MYDVKWGHCMIWSQKAGQHYPLGTHLSDGICLNLCITLLWGVSLVMFNGVMQLDAEATRWEIMTFVS